MCAKPIVVLSANTAEVCATASHPALICLPVAAETADDLTPAPIVRHNLVTRWFRLNPKRCRTVITHEWEGVYDAADTRMYERRPNHAA